MSSFMTSLVDTTMYRPKKKMTKLERLTTGLYKTHYPMLMRCLEHWIGNQADDIISQMGERLTRNPDIWDGNDELLPHFLVRSARRLAINRIRDRKKEYADCDRLADLRDAGGSQQHVEVCDPHTPEEHVLAHMQAQEWRNVVLRSTEPHDRLERMALLDEMLLGGFSGNEYAHAKGCNTNTVHGRIKIIRMRRSMRRSRRL